MDTNLEPVMSKKTPGHLIKLLWRSGDGLCLLDNRLERGRFIWPQTNNGSVADGQKFRPH